MLPASRFILPLVLEKARTYSMDDWQEYFHEIYGKQNEKVRARAFSDNKTAYLRGYVLAHITEDLGNLAERVREEEKKSQGEGLRKYLGSVFAWLFALAEVRKVSLEGIVFQKFPDCCAHCGEKENCIEAWWGPGDILHDKHPKPKPVDLTKKPHNLQEWYTMFDRIYGRKIRIAMPIDNIMHKLYEELAEIFKAMEEESKENTVEYEVPDFVSWVFGLIIKLRHYSFIQPEDPADILIEKFGSGCPQCEGRRRGKKRSEDILSCQCDLPAWTNT